jgi:hypothetical protein
VGDLKLLCRLVAKEFYQARGQDIKKALKLVQCHSCKWALVPYYILFLKKKKKNEVTDFQDKSKHSIFLLK